LLLTDRDKICNLYRGPSIDASYQISVHFGQAVSEEKIFLEMWLHTQKKCKFGLFWQKSNLLTSLYLTRPTSFLNGHNYSKYNFLPIAKTTTFKKKMWKDDRRQVMAKAHVAFGKVSS
jgi:hypothetical protein